VAGFIKIYRSCRNNILWRDKPFSRWQAFEDLLLSAAYEPHDTMLKGHIVHLETGQLIRGVHNLAADWGWSVKKTMSFIKLLDNQKMATSKGTPQGTLITIENWAIYQDQGLAKGTPKGTTKGTPRRQQRVHEEEVEEIQEVKEDKNIYSGLPEQLIKPFEAYLEVRKSNRWKTTDYAIKLLLNKLNELAKGNINLSEKIINQSIERSYRSFFPVGQQKKDNRRALDELIESGVLDE